MSFQYASRDPLEEDGPVDKLALRALGDSAFTIDLAEDMGEEATRRVARATGLLLTAAESGRIAGVVEVVRALRSVTVHYDPLVTRRALIETSVTEVLAEGTEDAVGGERQWLLPACYDPALAPDLEDAARTLDLSPDEVVARHLDQVFRVHMIGFLPGFPFMGDLPEGLRLPRRAEPRTRVPAGSLAIADRMTAVYPWESPGGWTLIGSCPVPLFSASWKRPALLTAADQVRFEPVSASEVKTLAADYAAGRRDPHDLVEARP
jgi:KipI family sensor histidine kinase inhibitor